MVGVETSANRLGDDALEYIVFGTAVRDAAFPLRAGDKLGMCTLSGQEVYQLRRLGAKVCGVVAHATANSIKLEADSSQILNARHWSTSSRNAELPEMGPGIAETRRRCLAAVSGQARAVGANQLVISTLKHEVRHHHFGDGKRRRHYFHVVFHVVGTAIKAHARQPHPSPMPDTAISMNIND